MLCRKLVTADYENHTKYIDCLGKKFRVYFNAKAYGTYIYRYAAKELI
jgi:hypothetical protein